MVAGSAASTRTWRIEGLRPLPHLGSRAHANCARTGNRSRQYRFDPMVRVRRRERDGARVGVAKFDQHVQRAMRTDAQIASLLLAFTLPIRRFGWFIDPNGARDKVVEHVASDLNLPIEGQEPK